MKSRRALRLVVVPAALIVSLSWMKARAASPAAYLVLAETPVAFPGPTDSNSPAYWEQDGTLCLLNSAGHPRLSAGPSLDRLGPAEPVSYTSDILGGTWMESVIVDADGTLFGYYHNEPPVSCSDERTAPRIGSARSSDGGATWHDLGILLEASPEGYDCDSPNVYFVGGVGDLSVILDAEEKYLYFFFSSYGRDRDDQGVAAARMLWADRDRPVGALALWRDGVWMYPEDEETPMIFTPILVPSISWHDPSGRVDAFWGPSIHWNTYLQQYVLMLNRARDAGWSQEGVYVTFSPSLEDPGLWSSPLKVMVGGNWYPQVVGLEPGQGTDKLAGERARFFLGGWSGYYIVFTR